jgi:hypothetical protein
MAPMTAADSKATENSMFGLELGEEDVMFGLELGGEKEGRTGVRYSAREGSFSGKAFVR